MPPTLPAIQKPKPESFYYNKYIDDNGKTIYELEIKLSHNEAARWVYKNLSEECKEFIYVCDKSIFIKKNIFVQNDTEFNADLIVSFPSVTVMNDFFSQMDINGLENKIKLDPTLGASAVRFVAVQKSCLERHHQLN
jgi:hypothetical protein